MAVLGHDEYGYLAILAPRTGCTAMGVHLIKQGTGLWLPERSAEINGTQVDRKHATLAALQQAGLVIQEQIDALHVFTTVRNPFDSLVSLWSKYVGAYVPLLDDPDAFIHRNPDMVDDIRFCADHTFSEWIVRTYEPLRDGTERHLYGGFIDHADTILRFERLQQDFDQLFRRLGHEPLPPIPVLNETENRGPEYRRHYDDRARAIIEDVFAADLERFGYTF